MSGEQKNTGSYRDLIAWQKAMDLAEAIYRLTANFPVSERFGLTMQLRRAAVSVPSNVAEGQGRLSHADFRHFLGNARGSLLEVETQVRLSVRLHFADDDAARHVLLLSSEVGRLINGLIQAVTDPPVLRKVSGR